MWNQNKTVQANLEISPIMSKKYNSDTELLQN